LDEAQRLLQKEPRYAEVVHPYMVADDLLGNADSRPKRYVIDFRSCVSLR